MPRYEVFVTADATVYQVVRVDSPDEDAAHDKAKQQAAEGGEWLLPPAGVTMGDIEVVDIEEVNQG